MRGATLLLVVGICCVVPGCGGGGLTQEDMLRHAIRRPSEDDENGAVAQAENAQAGNAQADAQTPQTAGSAGQERNASPRDDGATAARPPGAPEADSQRAQTTPNTASPVDPGTPAAGGAPPATAATSRSDAPRADQPEPREDPQLAPPSPLSDRPAANLSGTEQRQRTIDNLSLLGDAIRQYVTKNGKLLPRAICNAKGQPMLSWRVELLPYLGHQELYDRFDVDEPWDSPRNAPLIDLIPDVYQSPERFDTRTNYLVPVASFSAFGSLRGISTRNMEDGLENTVVLLEVDDALAVPWTQPADYAVDIPALTARTAPLRSDGTFVVWGDGSITCVTPETSTRDWKAILSFDGGDIFAAHAVRAPAEAVPANVLPEAPAAAVAAAIPRSESTATELRTRDDGLEKPPARRADDGRSARTAAAAIGARTPIPQPQDMERARRIMRDIYGERYDKSRSARDQQQLAKDMLRRLADMKDDPAGQYVVLDIVMQIATQTGDSATAVDALEELLVRFDVNELEYKFRILQQLAKRRDRSQAVNQALLEQAGGLLDAAVEAEDFDTAEALCQIALGAARQLADRDQETELEQRQRSVREARRAYQLLQRTMAQLDDANDPQANLDVGRYFCLVRGEWEKGLPLLANGPQGKLKSLAEAELAGPDSPEQQVALADQWWELVSSESEREKTLRIHAGHWYQRALPALPQGLLRVKAELRIKQIEQDYGPDALASGS